MQIHVMIEPHNGGSYDDQLAVARAVQDCGLAGLFRSDHYYSLAQPRTADRLTDTWTTLAGLARDTSGITLGSLVTAATFRAPASLAVIAAQVDSMSGGRVELGIGTGWWQAEHEAYGIPLPAQAERFERLAEQLAVITGLWQAPAGSRFSYAGRHYQLRDAPAINCFRPGGPPIIIGGSGARRTPELAARHATEFNSGWQSPEQTSIEFDRVRQACQAIHRDPLTIRLSTVQTLCVGTDAGDLAARRAALDIEPDQQGVIGRPAEAADQIRAYQDAGADRIYLELLDLTDLGQLSLFADRVLPLLRN